MASIASSEEVKAVLARDDVVVIDIRSEDEINATGRYESCQKWFHAPGSLDENATLEANAEEWLPDKHVPIVVHCAAGRRAAKAKEILEAKGYDHVLNVGGYDDLKKLCT